MGWGVTRRIVTFQGGIVDIDRGASEGHTTVMMRSEGSGGEEFIMVCCEALKNGGRALLRLFIVKLGKIPG